MISIILSSVATFLSVFYIWFTEHRLHIMRKQTKDHQRKLYLVDRDIKTLHSNQKVLQSSIKELHKDLRVYGEVKKSRIKAFNKTEDREESVGIV